MTPLPLELNIGGFTLQQLKRTRDHAIYAQKSGGTIIAYEVIKIQKRPAQNIMGRAYLAREGYPSNEQWGFVAWTCATQARAEERFAALCA